ncbi:phosphoethanolamine transferase [Providencia rettgeri]|uniref:phosphoethanolamine transferase n=1 Tax=Providencia rettgeri TaxID=587 RepID=UPI0018E3FACB|nr:phosphoethanolamine transferase [Providencia rettgeri]MBI6200749.1 phosphoethanolamine transferase [Providencia rettgeri]MCX9107760.1 phosphoethanolamine transferase [Providencia rettgeri]
MIQKIQNVILSKIMLKFIALFFLFSILHKVMGYPFKPLYIFFISIGLLYVKNNIYRFIVLFFTILAAVYLPVGLIYGSPTYNTVASFYYTDIQESREFISNIDNKYFIYSILILAFGTLVSFIKANPMNYHKKTILSIVMVVFFFTPSKYALSGKYERAANSGTPETRFFTELIYSIYSLINEVELYTSDDTFKITDVNNQYDTYVIVIGESVRKDFMQEYGFKIQNTPFMSSINGTFFTNYTSAASSTQPSLTHSLSLYPEIGNNIMTLANKAGFDTYWLSNQGFVGEYDGSVAAIGRRANNSFFIKRRSSDDKLVSPDDALLPEFKLALKSQVPKKLIVVHLMGSHTPFCTRTEEQFDHFYQNKKFSCYVQSIKNTDKLLSEIYSDLSKTKSKWSMMYFSDHALSLTYDKNELAHSDKYKQNYEVPFFITSYNSKHKEMINSRRSGLSFMSLFSQWTGIEESNIESNCDMLSKNDCPNQNIIIDFNRNHRMFDDLPDDYSK